MNSILSQQAVKGTFWMISSFGIAKVVGMIANIALARLLFPDDFGVFAIALTAVGIVTTFVDLGTGAAVIYEQGAHTDHTNSAFWITVLAGFVQAVGMIVGAQWISELYGQALLRDILMALSVVVVAVALGETHQMLLSRDLRFKAKALLELLPNVTAAVVSVAAAFLGFGVWSLVYGVIVGTILANALAWRLVPWRPSLRISLHQARSVIRYGRSLLGLGLLMFLSENIDYLIIGRILGTAPLGLYAQGYRLATYPETTVVWAVEKVAFPTFSKLRDDMEALHSAFLKTIRYLALLSFPSLTLLLVLAPQFVITLYGSRWEGTILPLQILCVLGMSRSVTAVSKQVLMAVGRPDITLKVNLVALPAAVVGVVIGTRFGIAGVAVAVTVFLSAGAWVLLWLTNRHIGLPFKRVVDALLPGAACALTLLTGLMLFQRFASTSVTTGGIWNLSSSVLIGCSLYLVSLLLFSRQTFTEALAVAQSFRKKRNDEVCAGLAR